MPMAARRMDVVLRQDSRPVVQILPEVMRGPAHVPGPIWDFVLDRIYHLCQQSEPDDAIDVIFERVDSLLSQGHFGECDRLLGRVDIERLDSDLMVAFLAITAAARDKLPGRTSLRARVAEALHRLKGEQYAAELMAAHQAH